MSVSSGCGIATYVFEHHRGHHFIHTAVCRVRDACPRSRTTDPDLNPYLSRIPGLPDYGSGSQSLPIPDPGSRTPEPKVTKEGSSVFSKKCWFFSHKLPESSQVYRFGIRDSGPEAHKPEYHIQGPPPPPAGMIPPPTKKRRGGGAPPQAGGGARDPQSRKQDDQEMSLALCPLSG